MAGVTPQDLDGLSSDAGPAAEGPIEIINACVALAAFVEATVLNNLANRLGGLCRSLARGAWRVFGA